MSRNPVISESRIGEPYTKTEDRAILTKRVSGTPRGVKLVDDEIAFALGRTVSGVRERRRVLNSEF